MALDTLGKPLITLMQATPAQRVAVARKLATCCRSRFGVARIISHLFLAAPKRLRSRFCRRQNSDELRAEGASALSAVTPNEAGDYRKHLSQTKPNQSHLFLSPHKTNTIIREERADKKATALSNSVFLSAPGLNRRGNVSD